MTTTDPRCSVLSRAADEPMPGSAPRADIWIVVEHPSGWGDAPLARAENGVRVVMARAAVDRTASLGFRVWVAHCADRPAVLRLGTVHDPDEVADWNLAEVAAGSHRSWGRPDPDPLLLVCANGRRDRCCGHEGARLADRLWAGPDAQRVLTCTHLGGHRFAPTALLLPAGVLLGRLDAHSAARLLPDARAGCLAPDLLRGYSTLSEPDQVADAAARRYSGHPSLDALPVELTETSPTTARAVVTLPAAVPTSVSSHVAVELALVPMETVPSCGRSAEELPRWVAQSVAPAASPPPEALDPSAL